MKTKNKRLLLWILAAVITLFTAYYQRVTGPTYPLTDHFVFNDTTYKIVYLRTHVTKSDAVIKFYMPNKDVYGFIYERVFPLKVGYTIMPLRRYGDTLVGIVTSLPPAGKMQYYIELYKGKKVIYSRKNSPVLIRFKGAVPTWILAIHVLFMFLTVFFGTAAGLLALFDDLSFRKIQIWTIITLLIGGFIFGPLVQKFAFGQLWTGVPFGWDLTDNKTLIALIGWLIAAWLNRKEARRWWVVAAAVLQLIVYMIPHSLYGSTYNPETGKIIQDFILPFFMLFK
jgi:hypothetical protein